jgi:virginiamycin B lyase
VANWFNQVFGTDSTLPASPEDMPNFAEHRRGEFSDDGLKIEYRVYDLPRKRLFPFSARPADDGTVWIPFYHQNSAGMLDPKTGEVKIYQVNNPGDPLAGRRAAIHSVMPEEQVVWLAAADANKLGRMDRRTGEIGLIAPPPVPPPGGRLGRGSIHDVWSDSNGIVWTTGDPLQRYDPKTGKWTQIMELPDTYGMAIDQNGDVWTTEFMPGGVLAKVDAKTLTVTKYPPPNKDSRPRRVVVDSKGNIWVGDWSVGALLRFDPRTETFREFKITGPEPTPYAIQVDKNDVVWFTSHYNDYLGRLDPQTGNITKYPLPITGDIGSREIFRDAEGRLWFSSPPNDRIISFMP